MMQMQAKSEAEARLRSLYRIMNRVETSLGGGEGVEGLYGSISERYMQRVLSVMRDHCGLGAQSHLLDVGAGLGRPLIHAMITERIATATGIELDSIKCLKAEAFLRKVASDALRSNLCHHLSSLPKMMCSPVEGQKCLGPATHAYSFWEGVPVDARVAFGRMFAASKSLRCVAVVQRSMRSADPAQDMDDDYGFGPLILVDCFPVKMSGSGQSFVAYVFDKKGEKFSRREGIPIPVGAPAPPPVAADHPARLDEKEAALPNGQRFKTLKKNKRNEGNARATSGPGAVPVLQTRFTKTTNRKVTTAGAQPIFLSGAGRCRITRAAASKAKEQDLIAKLPGVIRNDILGASHALSEEEKIQETRRMRATARGLGM